MALDSPTRTPLAPFTPAAVGLTLFVAMAEIRMDDPWSTGALLALAAVPAILLLTAGLAATRGGNGSPAAVTIHLVAGLVLAGIAISRLGNVVDGDRATSSGGALTFMLLGFAALAWFCTLRSRSVACLLIAALASVGLWVEAVNWIFDTENLDTYRALLAASFALLFAAGTARGERPGTVLVAAAGIVALVSAALNGVPVFFVFSEGDGAGWGWELVALAQGLALLAYAAAWLEPGPGYLAFFALGLFVMGAGVGTGVELIDSGSDEPSSPSLAGWPLALAIATVLATLWGLRSARITNQGH